MDEKEGKLGKAKFAIDFENATATCPNGPSGRAASDRRVFADPVVCRPASSLPNRR